MWDCCSAEEGFVLSRGIPGDEKTQHFKAQGCLGLPGISALCLPAGPQSSEPKGSRMRSLCEDALQGQLSTAAGREGGREAAAKTAAFSSQESLEKATASKEGVVCMASQRKLSRAPRRLEFGSKRRSSQLPAFPPPEGTFGGSLGTGRDPCSRAAWGTWWGWSHPTLSPRCAELGVAAKQQGPLPLRFLNVTFCPCSGYFIFHLSWL